MGICSADAAHWFSFDPVRLEYSSMSSGSNAAPIHIIGLSNRGGMSGGRSFLPTSIQARSKKSPIAAASITATRPSYGSLVFSAESRFI